MEITRIGLILLFVLTPTYMPKTETLRACDIIIPSSQGRCVAICYIYGNALNFYDIIWLYLNRFSR